MLTRMLFHNNWLLLLKLKGQIKGIHKTAMAKSRYEYVKVGKCEFQSSEFDFIVNCFRISKPTIAFYKIHF